MHLFSAKKVNDHDVTYCRTETSAKEITQEITQEIPAGMLTWRRFTRQLPSSLAPQSQKNDPYLAYEISWSLWQTFAQTVQTPTPSTILQVWQWYLHKIRWVIKYRASGRPRGCIWLLLNGQKYQAESQNTSLRYLPVLIHEFFLCDGEGTEFITKGIFILSRRKLFWKGVIATVKAHGTEHIAQTQNAHLKNSKL